MSRELERERGFNNFLSLIRNGELIREWGLIEDLWYARFFKTTVKNNKSNLWLNLPVRAFSIHRIPRPK